MRARRGTLKRQQRTRKNIKALSLLPRITVFRSNKYLSAQIVDDIKKVTIASVSEKEARDLSGNKTEKAKALGLTLAQAAKKKKITKAVFDRGRYAYHGRVKAFAESLREGGIQI